jgi:HEPN domain-containing protein
MTKSDHILYWKSSAAKSLQAANHLFEKNDFVESLFFAHLALEKILKARWVADNDADFPPRTHNLLTLAQ